MFRKRKLIIKYCGAFVRTKHVHIKHYNLTQKRKNALSTHSDEKTFEEEKKNIKKSRRKRKKIQTHIQTNIHQRKQKQCEHK